MLFVLLLLSVVLFCFAFYFTLGEEIFDPTGTPYLKRRLPPSEGHYRQTVCPTADPLHIQLMPLSHAPWHVRKAMPPSQGPAFIALTATRDELFALQKFLQNAHYSTLRSFPFTGALVDEGLFYTAIYLTQDAGGWGHTYTVHTREYAEQS